MDEKLIEQMRLVVKFIVTHVNAKEAHEIGKKLRDTVK